MPRIGILALILCSCFTSRAWAQQQKAGKPLAGYTAILVEPFTVENISYLSMGSWVASASSHPENVVVTIHFRQRTSVGSKLTMRVDLPTTMSLLKYIRQAQSGSSFE